MDPNECAPLKKRKIATDDGKFEPKSFQLNPVTDGETSAFKSVSNVSNNTNSNNIANNNSVSVSEQNVLTPQKDDDVSGTENESSEHTSDEGSAHAANHIPSDGETEEPLTNYPDGEIEDLWSRLTDNNKMVAIKAFLRKHPEDIAILYTLADQESNVIEYIQSEFRLLEESLKAAVKPDVDVMDKLDPNYEDPSRREKYRRDLENRTENPELDAAVKAIFGFVWRLLDTCREYFQAGKISAATSMFTTAMNLYIECPVCKEGFASVDEEKELAQRLLKCLLCYLDSEQQKPTLATTKELFLIIDALLDNVNDEGVRGNFAKKYREIKRNYVNSLKS